jgi:hypothetical protein
MIDFKKNIVKVGDMVTTFYTDFSDDKIELQLNDYTIENCNGTCFLIKKKIYEQYD